MPQPAWKDLSRFADHRERGELLLQHADDLSDGDYWLAVADAWQDSDRQPLSRGDWRRLFTAERPGRENLMTAQARARLSALPERVEIFRGVNAYNVRAGLSWTLDRELASWFARRYTTAKWPGAVSCGQVRRERILALFDARTETEIIVFPRYAYGQTWTACARQLSLTNRT